MCLTTKVQLNSTEQTMLKRRFGRKVFEDLCLFLWTFCSVDVYRQKSAEGICSLLLLPVVYLFCRSLAALLCNPETLSGLNNHQRRRRTENKDTKKNNCIITGKDGSKTSCLCPFFSSVVLDSLTKKLFFPEKKKRIPCSQGCLKDV